MGTLSCCFSCKNWNCFKLFVLVVKSSSPQSNGLSHSLCNLCSYISWVTGVLQPRGRDLWVKRVCLVCMDCVWYAVWVQLRPKRAWSSFTHLSALRVLVDKYRHMGTLRVIGHCLTEQLKIVPLVWTVCPGRKTCFSLSSTVGLQHLTENTPWAQNKSPLLWPRHSWW